MRERYSDRYSDEQLDDLAACFHNDFYLGDREIGPVAVEDLAREFHEYCDANGISPRMRQMCWDGNYLDCRFDIAGAKQPRRSPILIKRRTMDDDQRETEAAAFVRWHREKGGDWRANFDEWRRDRDLARTDAFLVCYQVMGALLNPDDTEVQLWLRRTVPTDEELAEDEIATQNEDPREPPF